MKNSIISICLYSFFVINCLAQNKTGSSLNSAANQNNTNPYQERIYLHTNSSFLLVGESLLFKTYCVKATNHTPSDLSTIAYIEVIDADASPVLQAKVLLKEGAGSGDFFLPSTLTSGNYTLIAYTQWMKNYSSENFFKKQITIINPFRKPDNLSQRKKSQLQIEFIPEGGKIIEGIGTNLDLMLENKIYQTRQKVSATLTMKDTLVSNLSISVRKIEKKISDPTSINTLLFLDNEKTNLTGQLPSLQYLPEVRNNLITGIVRRKDNTPAAKEKVYLSIPSKEYLFLASITDSTGRFYFNTDKIKFNADLILQVAPSTCPDCQIKLDGNGLNDYKNFVPAPLEIDSSFQKIIEQRSVFAQIENAYYLQKQDSIIDIPETMRFYGQPDKTYLLDDYVRFPTMEDILIEYVLEIILKKKGDEFEIKVMNLRKREAFSEDPLILLDGIPIFDISQLMGYNPLLLKKIEIVGRRYFYGPIETQGIISFTTYDGTGKNISVTRKEKYLGILPQKSYFSPAYDEASQVLATIPDYRTQLYWNPNIKLSGEPMTFEFFTSDVKGDFEILVEGIRADGQLLHHREVIHVNAE